MPPPGPRAARYNRAQTGHKWGTHRCTGTKAFICGAVQARRGRGGGSTWSHPWEGVQARGGERGICSGPHRGVQLCPSTVTPARPCTPLHAPARPCPAPARPCTPLPATLLAISESVTITVMFWATPPGDDTRMQAPPPPNAGSGTGARDRKSSMPPTQAQPQCSTVRASAQLHARLMVLFTTVTFCMRTTQDVVTLPWGQAMTPAPQPLPGMVGVGSVRTSSTLGLVQSLQKTSPTPLR
jgi:hypothetical protein